MLTFDEPDEDELEVQGAALDRSGLIVREAGVPVLETRAVDASSEEAHLELTGASVEYGVGR